MADELFESTVFDFRLGIFNLNARYVSDRKESAIKGCMAVPTKKVFLYSD